MAKFQVRPYEELRVDTTYRRGEVVVVPSDEQTKRVLSKQLVWLSFVGIFGLLLIKVLVPTVDAKTSQSIEYILSTFISCFTIGASGSLKWANTFIRSIIMLITSLAIAYVTYLIISGNSDKIWEWLDFLRRLTAKSG